MKNARIVAVALMLLASVTKGGEPNWRFAPQEPLEPPKQGFSPQGEAFSASVECLTPVVPSGGYLKARIRLHWLAFTIRALNPFMDPLLEPVAQLAVFDEGGKYYGSLTGWQPSNPLNPIIGGRSRPVAIRWDRGVGVTGRTITTTTSVQPERGKRVNLPVGRYRMQLIVYDRIFDDGTEIHRDSKLCCRSDSVPFDVVAGAGGLDADAAAVTDDKPIEFRFVDEPLRFEIENRSAATEKIYDPWLVNYHNFGAAGAYRFEWRLADNSVLIDPMPPRGIPNRDAWVTVPSGGFAGREVFFKPSDSVLDNGQAKIEAVVLKGALARHAFPIREAPWEFVRNASVILRSEPAVYVFPSWREEVRR